MTENKKFMCFRLSLLAGAALLIGGLGGLPAGAQILVPERPGDERQRFPEIPLERAPAPGLTLSRPCLQQPLTNASPPNYGCW
jgi:hypothetical protein